jgi:histidyl-tRNA synthetase
MLQPPKGTRDLLPEQWSLYQKIYAAFLETLREYNFSLIELPIFEYTKVFSRGLGEGAEISKEMYNFEDRNGDSLTLRPEGTASLVRAYLSSGIAGTSPSARLAYAGPMFRYERPQKGRYRQFYQLGIEALGHSTTFDDIEVLDMGDRFLSRLGLREKVRLEINTLGDSESRQKYLEALVDFFSSRASQLSPESQHRLKVNPLRILDSKQEADQVLLKEAPLLRDFLTADSQQRWEILLSGLKELNIPYVVNPLLVRGLDYYSHTVFEFTAGDLGAQNAVLSGGRYDGLVQALGGPATPAVGWAAGWDRLSLLVDPPEERTITAAILPLDQGLELKALKMAQELRQNGESVEIISSGNMSKKLKKAAKLKARFALMFGQKEADGNVVLLKNLGTGVQVTVSSSQVLKAIQSE